MKDQQNLDALFQKAKSQSAESSFEETKEQFLSTLAEKKVKGKKTKTQFLTFKNGLIMIAIISTIIISISLIPEGESLNSENKNQPISIVKGNEAQALKRERDLKTENYRLPEVIQLSKIEMDSIVNDLEFFSDPVLEIILPQAKTSEPKRPTSAQPFRFPILTEKEKNDNQKQKKKMVKALIKLDKKSYAYVPSGSFKYHGKPWSVQSFHMQTTEVTNLEYRTFLFDLLINDRKDEFLLAAPDQSMWTTMFGDSLSSMQNLYFSDKAFNDYPVVNVSRKGAEMYCDWITIEANKIKKSKNQAPINDVRLPVRAEWELAASGTGEFTPYPWGGPLAQNEKGCYLANFDVSNYDSPMKNEGVVGSKTVLLMDDDGASYTAKIRSYIPNAYGLYNMSGNVAEMVSEGYDYSQGNRIATEPGTAGGGWMSSIEEIKIDGKDAHSGVVEAHPNIGFRVVMTYLNTSK